MAKGREDTEHYRSRCDRLPRHSQKLSCGTGPDTSPKNCFLMPRRQIVAVCAISLFFFCVGRVNAVGQPGGFPSDPDRKGRTDGKIGHGRRRQIIERPNFVNSLVPPSFAEEKVYPVHVSPHEKDVERLPRVQLYDAREMVQEVSSADFAEEVILWADRERPIIRKKGEMRPWLRNWRVTYKTPEGTRDVLYCHGAWEETNLSFCVKEILGTLDMRDYFAKAKAVRGVSNSGGTLVVVSDFLKHSAGNPHHVLYLNCIRRTSDDLCNKPETQGVKIEDLKMVYFPQMFALRTLDIIIKAPANSRVPNYKDCVKISLALHSGSSMRSSGGNPVSVRCNGIECRYFLDAAQNFNDANFEGEWKAAPLSEIPLSPGTGKRLEVNGPEEKPWPRIYCWTGVGKGRKELLWGVTQFIIFYSRSSQFTVLKNGAATAPAAAESN